MTDAAKAINNPPVPEGIPPRRGAIPEYTGLLDPNSSNQLAAILQNHSLGLVLREVASILEVQARNYLSQDSDFTDPVQSQDAYLKNANANRLRSIATTF
jgi:hypothetical protein